MAASPSAPKMQYSRLGNSGLIVSRLSLGSWVTFGPQVSDKSETSAYSLMKAGEKLHEGRTLYPNLTLNASHDTYVTSLLISSPAYAAGVNLFDNAESYSTGEAEMIMGAAIAEGIKDGVWGRSDVVVTTKLFFGTGKPGLNTKGCSRKHIVEGLQASLDRMRLSHVDVVFCHRPDVITPVEETVRAMNNVIDRGLALYWGTSEWPAKRIQEAWEVADRLGLVGPICEQPEYHIFQRGKVEVDFAPLYSSHGLGLTTWSPLASGVLTGKYSAGTAPPGSRLALPSYDWLAKMVLAPERAPRLAAADKLKVLAEETLGCTASQLAIAWCLRNDHVSTVLLGATSLAQLTENLGALSVVPKLTPEVMAQVDAIVADVPMPPTTAHANAITFRGAADILGAPTAF